MEGFQGLKLVVRSRRGGQKVCWCPGRSAKQQIATHHGFIEVKVSPWNVPSLSAYKLT